MLPFFMMVYDSRDLDLPPALFCAILAHTDTSICNNHALLQT